MTQDHIPNRLIHESSPYLLQHAYNPVDWFPWSEEALAKAKKEDKPIILSIGYSACHWCHVMERESFENEVIAHFMSEHYVCIKVDREERPDIDQIYMDAVHAMGLQGGWPLNVILTPDSKPFYGGTYFPPQKWLNLLQGVQQAFQNDRQKLEESADGFAYSLNRSEFEKYGLQRAEHLFKREDYDAMFAHLAKSFDQQKGGMNRAPKFPMPCVWLFVMRYYAHTKHEEALKQLHVTLQRMALGGIYDQIGGGFARYSTDEDWFAPHFEKMLYDNGQLVSLYAEAWQLTKEPLYKATVYQTIEFLERELTSPDFGFYAALDADSEGIEGKFYVWEKQELDQIELPQREVAYDYYHITEEGTWEHGYNIPYLEETSQAYCQRKGLDHLVFQQWETQWKAILLQARAKKVRPGLDNKILTSWNGLMLNGIIDAYRVFNEEQFLQLALRNAHFIKDKLASIEQESVQLFHARAQGKKPIAAYLEDYATVIQAYTNLYEATFDEQWLQLAEGLTKTALSQFFDPQEQLFFYTASTAEELIARKKELFDNVIPSSNSMMALNLIRLGHLLANDYFVQTGTAMVQTVQRLIGQEVYYLANWAVASLQLSYPIFEIAIAGPQAQAYRKHLDQQHYPNKVMVGTIGPSNLELLEDRGAIDGKTAIYICQNKTCQLPLTEVNDAFSFLRQ